MEEKFKLHIDSISYKDKKFSKNQEEMKKLKYRLQGTSPPVEVTLKELIEAIQEGKAVSPAVMKGTKADDFLEQQVFMIDIDNTNTENPILQVADAISICEKKDLHVAFYYYSFSHTKELPKYRLVFAMDEVVTDRSLRNTIMRRLIDLFEQTDTSCTNADRVFFGTNKEAIICDLEARITVDDVLKIPPKTAIVEKKKTSRADKELEKLINDFDFLTYLKERNGNVVRDNPRYIMFENCEVCGHKNDLVYYPETNSFKCFSDKGDVGGTIIDYLKEVYKLTPSQAIKKFKKELCRMSKTSKELKIIRMSDIEPQEVKWLWYPYIPAGKVTMLQGMPRRRKNPFCH